MTDCLFCKFSTGEIQPEMVMEDEEFIAFRDINPQAPIHILIVPRRHISTANDLTDADAGLIGRMYLLAQKIAMENGVAEEGYRLVMNCNRGAGQSVFHIHLHFLAGRQMHWPPG